MTVDLSPYSSARPLFGPLQTWLPDADAQRMAAYQLYEGMYHNVPESYRLIQRGSEANPIYVPSAKILIEATNRFLAKNWTYSVDPRIGDAESQAALDLALQKLFAREEMWSKFACQRRYGLIRGDVVWHVVADPLKPEGRKISIYEVDPAAYFPIEDPSNADRIVGCHIVEPMDNGQGSTILKRQTYRKQPDGTVTYELSWWEMGGWDDREGSGQKLKRATKLPPDVVTVNETPLPESITALPVYHVKNSRSPGSPFGRSALSGLERIAAAVSQAISDEELALAFDGLGVYATTSGPPVDEDGKETNWKIGPGWVVEIDQDATWQRVNGVSSVAPMLDHVAYLDRAMREAMGVSDVAIGRVDVQVAESGISLALQLAPLLAMNAEREIEMLPVYDHMLYDLANMWLPEYEGLVPGANAVSIVDDPMPQNRKAILDEIVTLVLNKLISVQYAQLMLSEKLGYEFPSKMLEEIIAEEEALAKARNADPFQVRIQEELDRLEAAGGTTQGGAEA